MKNLKEFFEMLGIDDVFDFLWAMSILSINIIIWLAIIGIIFFKD